MPDYFYNALHSFRGVFSRHSTWVVWMVVCGFVGAEIVGVSSFYRFWGLGGSGYHTFLHFFRSSAWTPDVLVLHWAAFVVSQDVMFKELGKKCIPPKDIRLGDGFHSAPFFVRFGPLCKLKEMGESWHYSPISQVIPIWMLKSGAEWVRSSQKANSRFSDGASLYVKPSASSRLSSSNWDIPVFSKGEV